MTEIQRADRALAKRRSRIRTQLLEGRAVADLASELAAEPDLEALGLEAIRIAGDPDKLARSPIR